MCTSRHNVLEKEVTLLCSEQHQPAVLHLWIETSPVSLSLQIEELTREPLVVLVLTVRELQQHFD